MAFDSWTVPCGRCRAEVGEPCRLVWWSRQREHAARFSRAWRLYARGPAAAPAPAPVVPYEGGGLMCVRCRGAAVRATDLPAFAVCASGGPSCSYFYIAPSWPAFMFEESR
jgi:hypothetical protein